MLYKKPNVRYVDMCKYIDDTVYTDQCDDDLVFQYLYHLTLMLARKGKLFSRSEYYEDFAVYFATNVFMRFKNPKQYECKPDGTPKLKQIKSVLNYLNKTIYPRKVDFEQQYYSQAFASLDDEDAEYDLEYSFVDKLRESTDDLSLAEFNMCLNDVAKTTEAFLKKIPYRTQPAIWHNIYVSCLLTFLSSITLTNQDIMKLSNPKSRLRANPEAIENMYNEESNTSPILFHLDANMSDYIRILTKELKHVIAMDLSLTLHTYIPSTSGIQPLAFSEINTENSYLEREYN